MSYRRLFYRRPRVPFNVKFLRRRHETETAQETTQETTQELCEACQPILWSQRAGVNLILFMDLGSPDEIAQRKDCRSCSLVTHLLSPLVNFGIGTHRVIQLRSDVLHNYLGVYSDKRSAYNRADAALGWIHVRHSTEPLNFPSDRELSEIDPAQVVVWLDKCSNEHGSVCNQLLVTRPIQDFLLIDVHAERLVSVEQTSEYVALSYVWGGWGGNEPTQTIKDNVDFLKTAGSFRAPHIKVPSVVRDAMGLCRRIGQSFLWCDLYCIINDCNATKHTQIQQMDAIYNRACLTIVALTGTHGDTPLPGVLNGSRLTICRTEILDSDIQLVSRAPSLPSARAGTVYDTRGWTFQETMLSNRRLFLAHGQMYFDCQIMCAREDERLECFPRLDPTSINVLVDSTVNSIGELLQDPQRDVFSTYSIMVGDYTRRELSYTSDIINAFEGIAQVLKPYFTALWVGLPTSHLDKALLWHHIYKTRSDEKSQGKLFPSWSWASESTCAHYVFPHDGIRGVNHRFWTQLAPQTVQFISAYYFSSFVDKDESLDVLPGLLESHGKVMIHQMVKAAQEVDPESAWRACDRSDARSSFYFCLDFILPTLTELSKVLSASGIDQWERRPLTRTSVLKFRDRLCRDSMFSMGRQMGRNISVTELDCVLKLLGELSPNGPLRLPEWPFKYFNAARWGEDEMGHVEAAWPFGEPLSFSSVESYLGSSQNLFRDILEFRNGLLREPGILSFWTLAVSDLRQFSMYNGQLFAKSGWYMTAQNNRYGCNILTLDFRKNDPNTVIPSIPNVAPATLLFDSSRKPCGVLYDEESRIMQRIRHIQRCSFIFISRMQRPEGDVNWDLLNFLLVEEKEGYTFERIVVGCMLADAPELEAARPKYIRLV